MKKIQSNKIIHLFDRNSIFLVQRAEYKLSVDMENVRVPLFGSGLAKGSGFC